MTSRKQTQMLRDMGKIYFSIFIDQQAVNIFRRGVSKKRREAEAIGKKLSLWKQDFQNLKNV